MRIATPPAKPTTPSKVSENPHGPPAVIKILYSTQNAKFGANVSSRAEQSQRGEAVNITLSDVLASAATFEERLRDKKAAIPGVAWYPYGSISCLPIIRALTEG